MDHCWAISAVMWTLPRSDEDFKQQLETLNEELETLNAQARDLEQTIASNVAEILEA